MTEHGEDDAAEESNEEFFHFSKWGMVTEFNDLLEERAAQGTPFNLSYTHDDLGRTCLIWSARNGNDKMTEYLLRQKAEAEAKDSDGATALLHACHANKESIARQLVEAGAKINTQDKHGNTPMLHTVARGNLNLATFIHGAGGHPEVQNKAGREFIHQNWHMYYNTYSQIYNANS